MIDASIVSIVAQVLGQETVRSLLDAMTQRTRERTVQKGTDAATLPQVPADLPSDPKDLDDLISKTVVAVKERTTPGEASIITLETLFATRQAADSIRKERLRQARMTFNVALSLATAGVVIIFVGIVLMFQGATTGGSITAAVGAVSEAASLILFRLNNDTNKRLDSVSHDLGTLESARVAAGLIDRMQNEDEKDAAIRALAQNLSKSRARTR